MLPDDHDPTHAALEPAALLADVRWVRRLALRLVREPSEADDLAQETWLAFARRPPPAEHAVRPWLARVLRNVLLMRRRSDRRRAARDVASAHAAVEPSAAELVARAEIQHRVVGMVLELREPHRSVLLMRFQGDLSAAEIARRRRLPAGTVRRQLKEALDLVRAKLDHQHGGDRERWRASMLLLLPGAPPVPIAMLGGLLAVKTLAKVAIVAAVLLTLAIVTMLAPPQGRPPVAPARVAAGNHADASIPAASTSKPSRESVAPRTPVASSAPRVTVRVLDRETRAPLVVNGVGARAAGGAWQRLEPGATPGVYSAPLSGTSTWWLRIVTPGYHGWDGWAIAPDATVTAELAPICRVIGRLPPGVAPAGGEVSARAATGATAARCALAADSSFMLDGLAWGEWYALGCSWLAGSDVAASRFQVTARDQDLGVIEVEGRAELIVRLTDASGVPAARAVGRITSYRGEDEIGECALAFDAAGRASVFLRSDVSHVLSASLPDRSAALRTERFAIHAPRDERRFVLLPTVGIAGVVRTEEGAPIAGAEVFIPEAGSLSAPWRMTTDARGAFAFTGFEPGRRYAIYAGDADHFQRERVAVSAPAADATVTMISARGRLRVKLIDARSHATIAAGRFAISGITGHSPDHRAGADGWIDLPDLRHLDESLEVGVQGYAPLAMRLADLTPDAELMLVPHERFAATIECPLALTPFTRLCLVFRAPLASEPDHQSIELPASALGFPARAPTSVPVSLPWLGAGGYTVEWRDNSDDPNDHYPRDKYRLASGSITLEAQPEQPLAIALAPSRMLAPPAK